MSESETPKQSFLKRVFEDYRGNPSFGRLAAGYCIVGSILLFVAGLAIPGAMSYCVSVGNSLLVAAGSLYGTSKIEQAGSTISTAVKGLPALPALEPLLKMIPGASPAPTADTNPDASKGE